jgi:thiol:disulfide interchange protein
MNLTVSPQMRIVALVGLIAVLGLGVSAVLLGRKGASSSANEPVPVQAVPKKVRPEAAVPSKPVRPAVTPSRPQIQPAVQTALRAGLPPEIARAFARHDVVVVELYSEDAVLDRQALAEADAGARTAGAGFVAVNVTAVKDATTRALALKHEVLHAPTLLVFRRPGTLFARINGFADHETVAQAAVNAAAATPVDAS